MRKDCKNIFKIRTSRQRLECVGLVLHGEVASGRLLLVFELIRVTREQRAALQGLLFQALTLLKPAPEVFQGSSEFSPEALLTEALGIATAGVGIEVVHMGLEELNCFY